LAPTTRRPRRHTPRCQCGGRGGRSSPGHHPVGMIRGWKQKLPAASSPSGGGGKNNHRLDDIPLSPAVCNPPPQDGRCLPHAASRVRAPEPDGGSGGIPMAAPAGLPAAERKALATLAPRPEPPFPPLPALEPHTITSSAITHTSCLNCARQVLDGGGSPSPFARGLFNESVSPTSVKVCIVFTLTLSLTVSPSFDLETS